MAKGYLTVGDKSGGYDAGYLRAVQDLKGLMDRMEHPQDRGMNLALAFRIARAFHRDVLLHAPGGCDACGGTGWLDCPGCAGWRAENGGLCICARCHGSGKVKCPACDGGKG